MDALVEGAFILGVERRARFIVFRLTGKRLRSLPFDQELLKA